MHAAMVEVDSAIVVRHVNQLVRHSGRERLATSHAFKAVTVMLVLYGTGTDAFCQGTVPESRRHRKLAIIYCSPNKEYIAVGEHKESDLGRDRW